jgi:hypothetical protein
MRERELEPGLRARSGFPTRSGGWVIGRYATEQIAETST